MLGTGTWHLKIGNMFYSGDITLRVFDDGGKYGFEIIEPKMTAPEVEINDKRGHEDSRIKQIKKQRPTAANFRCGRFCSCVCEMDTYINWGL